MEESEISEIGRSVPVPMIDRESELGASCEQYGAYYCAPFLECRCRMGCNRLGEMFTVRNFEEMCGAGCNGSRPCCCSSDGSVRLTCTRLWTEWNLSVITNSVRSAYDRWRAFIILLALSLMMFLGVLTFLRVPEQGGEDQLLLIQSINKTLVGWAILIVLTGALVGCTCFFVLYEGVVPYGGQPAVPSARDQENELDRPRSSREAATLDNLSSIDNRVDVQEEEEEGDLSDDSEYVTY
jgi:hypothetical protein